MRRKHSANMMIAFLDTLSNAMAAILIIAIIQLNPSRDDGLASGLFFIKASLLEFSNESNLGMRINKGLEIVFDEDPPLETDYHFMHSDGSTILFLTKPLDKEVRIFIFLKQNILDYSDSIAVSIDVSLPGIRKETRVLSILKEDNYEVEIPKEMLR